MAAHYPSARQLFVLVFFVLTLDGVTNRHVRVKRDKRPIGLPISTPIKTDGAFLGGSTPPTSPISSGFFSSSLDESSLTRLKVPGFSRPNGDELSSAEQDDSLTKLQVPGVSLPNAGTAFSSLDPDDSLTKLQVPGISSQTKLPPFSLDESTLTQLQVPGISNQNVDEDSLGKRQVSSTSRPVIVGFSTIDVGNDEVKEIALFATNALAKNRDSILKLKKILKAEAEDVAGKNFKLLLRIAENLDDDDGDGFINCQVIVFDQSWTSTRILRDSECSPSENVPISSIESVSGDLNSFNSGGLFPSNNVPDASLSKRQVSTTQRPIGGGFFAIDVDNEVKKIAIFAATAIASKRDSGPARVTKIVKAESQNVAGTNYKLTLEINQPLGTQKFIICDALIFDQSWTKTRILSEHNCKVNNNPTSTTEIVVGKNSGSASSSAGSSSTSSVNDSFPKREVTNTNKFSTIEVDDADVKEVAEFAMKVANTAAAASGHSSPVKLLNIIKAEWQVVDAVGRNFKLTLELDDGAEESLLCVVSIFEQSTWKSSTLTISRSLTESTCFAT